MLWPVKQRIDAQQHRIELISGGSLDFWSMDDDDPARGRKYSIVIIDEADMTRRLIDKWQRAIRPTLIDYRGSAWFFSTPRGIQDFHKLFQKGVVGSDSYDDDWISWQMPSTVNPFLDPAEIEAARLELPQLVFNQEILAQFVDFGGTVVYRDDLRYGTPPPLNTLTVSMGVDLAISTKTTADYTAIVVLGREKQGKIWVLDVARDRVRFHDGQKFIQQMAEKWNPATIRIEEVQFQAAVVQELLRTTTLPVQGAPCDKDKLTRFQPVAARYEQHLIYHAVGLPGYFDDELLSFPVGLNDDMADAEVHAFNGLGAYNNFEIKSSGKRTTTGMGNY
jgi:predicted phage terminase large subunit-like protein